MLDFLPPEVIDVGLLGSQRDALVDVLDSEHAAGLTALQLTHISGLVGLLDTILDVIEERPAGEGVPEGLEGIDLSDYSVRWDPPCTLALDSVWLRLRRLFSLWSW